MADNQKRKKQRLSSLEHTGSASLQKMSVAVGDLVNNCQLLLDEWGQLKSVLSTAHGATGTTVGEDEVRVKVETLSQLSSLASQLQTTLPSVLRTGLSAANRAASLQQDLGTIHRKTGELASECSQWKNKFKAMSSSCQKEKEEVCKLQREVAQLSAQLNQQSEFCSSLGAATVTLLWRVSRSQDAVSTLLTGSKADEFLGLACSTVQSYLSAYCDDWPEEESSESCFILALCGTITNIAASSYGRDFLLMSERGKQLADALLSFISQAPLQKSAKIKSLMLMCLYNLSINQKGVQYLITKPDILPLLTWHLKEETNVDNRLNTLKLLQSVLADDSVTSRQLLDPVEKVLVEIMGSERNKQLKDLASELLVDLKAIHREQ